MPSPSTTHIRQGFNTFMRNQASSAHANGTPTRRAEPIGGPLDNPTFDRPTHPAFDRLGEIKTKQLQEASRFPSNRGSNYLIDSFLQDHKTLKKGFNRLHERYAESTAKITALEQELAKAAALEQELDGYRTDCRQLRAQVEHVEAQVVAANNANSALRVTLRRVCTSHSYPMWAH